MNITVSFHKLTGQNNRSETIIYDNNCNLPEACFLTIRKLGTYQRNKIRRTVLNDPVYGQPSYVVRKRDFSQCLADEHNEGRRGYTNGYKPLQGNTRVGNMTLTNPQVREGNFYAHALEKWLRIERAFLLTLAEMYVQGVSTRKVAAIIEPLCDTNFSGTQISRTTKANNRSKNKVRPCV